MWVKLHKTILPISTLILLVLVSIIILFIWTTKNNNISYINTINEFKKENVELNEYIDDLIEYIETTPDTIYVDKIIYKSIIKERIDTIFIQEKIDYYDIDTTLTSNFKVVDKEFDSFIQLNGYVVFRWNLDTKKYELTYSEITDKIVNLNLAANYTIDNSLLDLRLSSRSSDINITYIENQTLDLSRVHTAKRSRWGLGIVGGIGLVNSGFTPFVGVGVTYQFKEIELKKLLGYK